MHPPEGGWQKSDSALKMLYWDPHKQHAFYTAGHFLVAVGKRCTPVQFSCSYTPCPCR